MSVRSINFTLKNIFIGVSIALIVGIGTVTFKTLNSYTNEKRVIELIDQQIVLVNRDIKQNSKDISVNGEDIDNIETNLVITIGEINKCLVKIREDLSYLRGTYDMKQKKTDN